MEENIKFIESFLDRCRSIFNGRNYEDTDLCSQYLEELEHELKKLRVADVIKNEVSVCVHENIEVILPIRRCLKCQHIEEWTPKQTVL